MDESCPSIHSTHPLRTKLWQENGLVRIVFLYMATITIYVPFIRQREKSSTARRKVFVEVTPRDGRLQVIDNKPKNDPLQQEPGTVPLPQTRHVQKMYAYMEASPGITCFYSSTVLQYNVLQPCTSGATMIIVESLEYNCAWYCTYSKYSCHTAHASGC